MIVIHDGASGQRSDLFRLEGRCQYWPVAVKRLATLGLALYALTFSLVELVRRFTVGLSARLHG